MKKWNLFGMAALMAAFIFCSCEQDDVATPENSAFTSSANLSTYSGTGETSSISYLDLTKEWWKYVLSIDCANNPLNLYSLTTSSIQPGGVAYLVGSKEGSAIRNVSVAQSQLLVVPIINKLSRYPCEGSFSSPDTIFNHLLHDEADKFIDQVTNIKVVLDGAEVEVSHDNRYATNPFAIRGNVDLSTCLDDCITGEVQNAVSDGYWLFLRGLSKGKHELTVHAEILQTSLIIDVKYIINVL